MFASIPFRENAIYKTAFMLGRRYRFRENAKGKFANDFCKFFPRKRRDARRSFVDKFTIIRARSKP